jgi:micrococcal nuclease
MSVSRPSLNPETSRRSNRWIILILLAAVVLGFALLVYRIMTYDPNYVVAVYDANRVVLKSGEGVFLIGVDCPPVQEKQVGEPASELTKKWLLNRHIRLEKDEEPKDRDGWILGYVFVHEDGQDVFVNEELLRHGFARVKLAYPNLKYRNRLEAAESEAKSKNIGLWSPDYKPPGS